MKNLTYAAWIGIGAWALGIGIQAPLDAAQGPAAQAAEAAASTAAPAAPAAVQAPRAQTPQSTARAKPASIAPTVVSSTTAPAPADLYKAERDPFMEFQSASPGSAAIIAAGQEPEPFNIHALTLKGIMRDKSGDSAILVQPNAGATYLLKKGKLYDADKLYDPKTKPIAGVTGVVKYKQKTVHIMTSDKDVQTLILGEQQEGI